MTTIRIKWQISDGEHEDWFQSKRNKNADKKFKKLLKIFIKQLKNNEINSLNYNEIEEEGYLIGIFTIN